MLINTDYFSLFCAFSLKTTTDYADFSDFFLFHELTRICFWGCAVGAHKKFTGICGGCQ